MCDFEMLDPEPLTFITGVDWISLFIPVEQN